jgi:hypothetical protein
MLTRRCCCCLGASRVLQVLCLRVQIQDREESQGKSSNFLLHCCLLTNLDRLISGTFLLMKMEIEIWVV